MREKLSENLNLDWLIYFAENQNSSCFTMIYSIIENKLFCYLMYN